MAVFKNKVAIEYSLVIAALTILTLIVFIKLLPHFSSAIVGDGGDGTQFLWNFWWVKKSVWELHQNPFISDWMFYPNIMDLRLHTLILAPALITLPIQLLCGPIVALNIYVLISFVLAGFGAYLLSKLYVKSRSAASLGAIIYAFNTYVISHTYGHFNLTTTWPIPFIVYFLERLYSTKKVKYAIWGSFCYIFLVYSDLQYAIFTALFIAIWLIWKILSIAKAKRSIFSFLKPFSLFVIFIVIGLYPLFSLITSGLNSDLSKPTEEAAEFYSPDILAYLIPPQGTIVNSIIANYNIQLAQISFSGPEWAVYLGLTVIILLPFIVIQVIRKRKGCCVFWTIVFFVFFVLSLGPELHFFADQDTGIILPFSYFRDLPLLNMARVPTRISIIAILAISVLIAWILSEIRSSKVRYATVAILGIIYIGELFSLPIYIQELKSPEAYIFLKEQSDSKEAGGSVIEFPLFFTDRTDILGKKETIFLYYQTIHEHKMINGYLSYTPSNFFKQYMDTPGMLFLVEPLYYGKPQDQDLVALKDFLYDQANVKYAVVHKNILSPAEHEYISQFLQLDLCADKIYDDQDIAIYEFGY